MQRSVLARAAQLLRSAVQLGTGARCATGASAADGSAHGLAGLLSLRAFTSSSAAAGSSGSSCRSLLQHQLPAAAAAAGRGAAAARHPAAASTGWRAVSAAALRQQSRGYARYLQFQPRGGSLGSGFGSRWTRLALDPDKTLWGLIGANVVGFMLWRAYPNQMSTHAMVSIEGLRAGRVWTAVTSAFSHKDFGHLAANMIGLYFFGRDIGHLFGGKKLLLLYLAGGVAGSLAHCGWYFYKACQSGEGRYGRTRWFGFTPSALGASAAVNAITVMGILLYPTRTILLYGIIPMPAALLGALWLLRDVTGTLDGHGSIAHAGHLGGAAIGLASFLLYKRGMIRPRGW